MAGGRVMATRMGDGRGMGDGHEDGRWSLSDALRWVMPPARVNTKPFHRRRAMAGGRPQMGARWCSDLNGLRSGAYNQGL